MNVFTNRDGEGGSKNSFCFVLSFVRWKTQEVILFSVLVQTEKDCYPNVGEDAWEDSVLRESWGNQAYERDQGLQLDM